MKISKTTLNDCLIIEPDVFIDDRGFFLETFQLKKYKDLAGIDEDFVQDNYSRSRLGVLRGLHFQKNKPQGKLVRCVAGAVFDVVVDLRIESSTFGKWFGTELSENNKKQIWVPPGFAHGFLTLTDVADFEYKCTDYYDSLDERAIIWNDQDLNVSWPIISSPKLSIKDAKAKNFCDFFL